MKPSEIEWQHPEDAYWSICRTVIRDVDGRHAYWVCRVGHGSGYRGQFKYAVCYKQEPMPGEVTGPSWTRFVDDLQFACWLHNCTDTGLVAHHVRTL